jgi:hypothetical protein
MGGGGAASSAERETEKTFNTELKQLKEQVNKLTPEHDTAVEFEVDHKDTYSFKLAEDSGPREGTWYRSTDGKYKVFVPDDLNTDMMSLNINNVERMLNDMPPLLRDSLTTMVFTDSPRAENPDKMANFNIKTGTITFFGDPVNKYNENYEDVKGTIGQIMAHELGHALDDKFSLPPNPIHGKGDPYDKEPLRNSAVWYTAHQLDNEKYITEYSDMMGLQGIVFTEDVAEGFGEYMAGDDVERAYFERDNPNKFKIIDTILSKK